MRRVALLLLAATAAAAADCAQPGLSGSSAPKDDVVGGKGQMDQVYREIYTPGSGTNY